MSKLVAVAVVAAHWAVHSKTDSIQKRISRALRKIHINALSQRVAYSLLSAQESTEPNKASYFFTISTFRLVSFMVSSFEFPFHADPIEISMKTILVSMEKTSTKREEIKKSVLFFFHQNLNLNFNSTLDKTYSFSPYKEKLLL